MATTRIQLLGWIEHCEREHPQMGTCIPTWLCSMDAVEEAERDGDICEIGTHSWLPRFGWSTRIFGLTDQGRAKLFSALPTAAM